MKRIAIISSLYKPTIPEAIGGQETWTANFTLEHARRGYTIDLFALPGSMQTERITLRPITSISLDTLKNKSEYLKKNIGKIGVAAYAGILDTLIQTPYDLIIDSSADITFSLNAEKIKKPLIVIGHFQVDKLYSSIFQGVPQSENTHFVFPTTYQTKVGSWLKNTHVVPHGIDMKHIQSNEIESNDKMLWVGRITNDDVKGAQDAIEVSKRTGKLLNVYAPFDDERMYEELEKSRPDSVHIENQKVPTFNKLVTPSLHKVLLYPLKWEEAFGLVLVEAMAGGTPVVAFGRGSVPEIVKDGVTGFVVNPSDDDIRGDFIIKKTGVEGLCEAVERLYSLSPTEYTTMRKACRDHALKNYSVEQMVDGYEKVYTSLT